MTFHQDEPPTSSKRCKFLTKTLKHALVSCHSSQRRLSSSSPEEQDDPTTDYDDEQEVFVSVVRSRYMEAKSRRKRSITLDSFCWALSPTTGEFFIVPKAMDQKEESEGEERDEFFSVGSHLSRCSSATNTDAFLSIKTHFSRCSSLSRLGLGLELHLPDFPRRLIFKELCHCEGWPFGLCRKALLLPPLPKSPAESWSWRKSKSARMNKLH